MSFIFNLLKNVFLRMLQILWFNKKKITNRLSIFIKTSAGKTLVVDLDPKWDIRDVKEIVATKTGIPPDDLKIILAGKELKNSTVIEECDLGQQSILHAVRTPKRLNKNEAQTNAIRESFSQCEDDEGSKPLNETLTDLSLDDSLEEEVKVEGHKAHFYIYCSNPCKSVHFGKLRVRCATCDSGAVTVDRDPQCWPDVLLPSRITVHCENPRCPTVNSASEETELQISYAHFYFKCSNHASLGEKDEAVPLYLIKSNLDKIPCLACTEINDTVLVFQCDNNHVVCLECFRNYFSVRLKERQFVFDEKSGYYTLACPLGCENSFIQEIHHFRLLPDQEYNRYQRFGTEEYVLKSGGILCPQPDCGMGIIIESEEDDVEKCRRITCIGGCGYVFCRNCLQGFHMGKCDSQPEIQSTSSGNNLYSLTKDNKKDEASRKAIRITTKPCPRCRTPTEKYGGCMHMICTRGGCGFQWCWVCQTEWTRNCMGNHWFG